MASEGTGEEVAEADWGSEGWAGMVKAVELPSSRPKSNSDHVWESPNPSRPVEERKSKALADRLEFPMRGGSEDGLSMDEKRRPDLRRSGSSLRSWEVKS